MLGQSSRRGLEGCLLWLLAKWSGGGAEDECVCDANLMKSVESPSVALAVVPLWFLTGKED